MRFLLKQEERMAKKTKKAEATGNFMDQLQEYRPPWEGPEDVKKEDTSAATEMKILQDRLAKTEGELAEYMQQQVYQSFQSAPTVTAPPEKKQPAGISFDKLPDPVTETDKYNQELAKRFN